MEIDVADFTSAQKLALFDLLILAMYADGHLTTFEDEQLQRLLTAMGHPEENDRQREFDAAVTRIRPHLQSLQTAKEKAVTLAGMFSDRHQQRRVLTAVEHIMTFDQHISTWETTLLTELRLRFRM
jgi:hypothetical protein